MLNLHLISCFLYLFYGIWFNNTLTFAVWGGDPVYPTINYIHDPDEVTDFRGPDFHEPTPDMLDYLKEVGTSGS